MRRSAALLCTLTLAGCAPAPTNGPLTVLAASSLADALPQVAAAWTTSGHPAVVFSFDASSKLAKQIEAGAPADAFFSADSDWMDYLDQKTLVAPGSRVALLGNRLVAVVPATATTRPSAAAELAAPEIHRLALAGERVPAGRYARASLRLLGMWDAVSDRVVEGDNVRTVLGWVASGEADAGVVYATDAAVEPRVVVAFSFPPDSHPPIVYPAAVIQGAPHAAQAADFLDYCRGVEATAVFRAAGFTPPPAAP